MTAKTFKLNSRPLLLVAMMTLIGVQLRAQAVGVSKARFLQGDDMNWAKAELDDASWSEIDITRPWDQQGFPQNTMSYAWYRIHVTIPKSVFQGSDQQNVLIFELPMVDDVDECYLNGKLIGTTGRMPTNPAGYFCGVNVAQDFVVDVSRDGVRLDADNVVAVRVYNRGGSGGLYGRPLTITCPKAADGITMSLIEDCNGSAHCDVEIATAYALATSGTFMVSLTDRETEANIRSLTKKLSIKRGKAARLSVPYDKTKMCRLAVTYTDTKTGKVLTESKQLKYILTPAAPATPRFNGAPVWGVRPGSPVIYRFPVSGERPMKFTCSDLPAGLQLTEDGVLSGKIDRAGDLTFTVMAENAKGRAQQVFTLKVGADMIG